jgi:hypothetical protein
MRQKILDEQYCTPPSTYVLRYQTEGIEKGQFLGSCALVVPGRFGMFDTFGDCHAWQLWRTGMSLVLTVHHHMPVNFSI